jgi:predicted transcriptional regulator
MAKSKWSQVKARLELVEQWARAGLNDKQIAKNLGISESLIYVYKKEHPDFLESLRRGRESFLAEVENAFIKRALGVHYSESKIYIKETEGAVTRYVEKSEKYLPPSVGACFILLKNKDRENWSNNPTQEDLDRERMEFEIDNARKRSF